MLTSIIINQTVIINLELYEYEYEKYELPKIAKRPHTDRMTDKVWIEPTVL